MNQPLSNSNIFPFLQSYDPGLPSGLSQVVGNADGGKVAASYSKVKEDFKLGNMKY